MEMPRSPALRADHSRLLLELSREIVSSLDLEEVYSRTIDAFRRILPFHSALIRLVEGDVLLTAAITSQGESPLEVRSPPDQGLAGAVLSSIEPVYVEDVSPDRAGDPSVLALGSGGGVRSYLGLALADGAGFLGVLELGAREPRAFTRDQIASAIQLAPSVAIAIRNAQSVAALCDEPDHALDQDFMSLVAHELRTPLAVVLGCAETIAAKTQSLDPVVIADLSRRAVLAGHRLERLIADLFDMSRIRNGSLHVVPVPTSLRSIVARAAGEAPPRLEIAVDLEEGLPLVDADPNRLVQVLRILLENASKHGGEHATVEVAARRDEEGGVCIEVSDRGPGIAPEVLHKVFDAFVQAEEPMTRSVGGLGIGLFLARGICELMEARIDARPRPGGGTSFVIHVKAAHESLEPVS